MQLDQYLNSLITIEFTDKKGPVSGFLLDYSEDWILLQSNPSDFMVDGYVVVANKNIEGVYRDENEIFIEQVIRLKGVLPSINKKIPLENTKAMFEFLNNEYGLFSFSKKSNSAIYPGKLIAIDELQIILQWIDLKGKWGDNRVFKLDKIRQVEFDNDYLTSLKLASENLYN